ncbi:hotdog fold thioesterase [candidate division KSB3 bacterium]|uniref:Hotdog fold thioesterase n=1 Tax=candidate division KSB3 bacterium TaxID=2044937 RepID=A0A9D5JYD5_9BACT|nr:hotdog fold thioesterase [candidate division KSB3 bacterium]MBD3326395.1 hotdog fold thioesterase [candidate division KSB3 bacterium]
MKKQANSRSCFLCGLQNEIGLKMCWYEDHEAQQIRATVTVPEHFNGYPGIVHGGILAAILDETSGRAVMLETDKQMLMVTLKLEMTYRRPTPTNTPLTAIGWVLKQTPKRAQVAGEIRLPDGTVTAQCKAIVVRPPDLIRERWEAEQPYWRVYENETVS